MKMNKIIQKAINFASKVHEKEFRRDGITPYMEHVQKVADVVASRGGGETEIVVAFLHDTLESGATREDLEKEGFNEEIIHAVECLTLDPERKMSYFDKIRQAKENEIARRVKIADNLANLSDQPTDKQILKYTKSLRILLEE